MTGSQKKDVPRSDSGKGDPSVARDGTGSISRISSPPVLGPTDNSDPSSKPVPPVSGEGSKPSFLTSPPPSENGETVEDKNEDQGTMKKVTDSIIGLFKRPQREVNIYKVPRPEQLEHSALPDGLEKIDTLDLGSRYVKVEIYLEKETNEYIYHPVEPKLAPRQKEVYDFIIGTFNKSLKYDRKAMENLKEKEKFLEAEVKVVLKDYSRSIGTINDEFLDPILYYIKREYIGYGKIQSIMLDIGVEDVSCDGTNIPIFVYHRNFGSIRTTIKFDTDEELEGFVVSLSQRAGKSISVADPILDATLPEGHRLNATFGREVTTRGSSFTIRKFKEDPLTITDLVKFGTISSEMAAHLWMAVQYGDSVIFAGGTASGKTATMNAISIFIPPSAKIISIEDTREVNLPHQNWIAGLTRGSAEGGRETDIDMYQLLRAALRQRPEYVLVGEVRGKETMTMFQAMATGHITYSTMHADSVKSIVYRLENPPISIPRVLIQALNLVAIHNQLRVKGMRVRRVTELVEIVGIEPTSLEIITNRVYKWEPAGDNFIFGGHSNLYEKIMDMEDMTRDEVVTELNKRAEIIEWMVRNDIRMFKDVSTIVAEYYENSDKVIKILRENFKVDIKKGMHIFDELHREKLPPSSMASLPQPVTPNLPPITPREPVDHPQGGV
ncbi:MAG: Flp pilus assembly complex ATPase component TadA [Candidatus Thermoplasmatota archaeon]|nr:Flp pilus assembly complex ATPase component TadA [Candidatus Thermoplasmatota archaeon]